MSCFNTQPPEGGCKLIWARAVPFDVSTHSRPKAAAADVFAGVDDKMVSTHSRPKAAAEDSGMVEAAKTVSTHSRPKAADNDYRAIIFRILFQHTAARRRLDSKAMPTEVTMAVSTHSRPKAAANQAHHRHQVHQVSTHSRPKAAASVQPNSVSQCLFQHTAARRRLLYLPFKYPSPDVSTHSRPKAAAFGAGGYARLECFNTQPPEGG